MLLAGIGAVVLAGGISYISTRSTDTKPLKPDDPTEVVISADAMVGKNMAQKEWRAQSENQIKDAVDRVKAIESKMPGLEKGGTDIAALQQENEKLKADGARLFKIYEEQNTAQAAKLKALEEGGVAAPGGRASGASIARWKQPASEPFRVAGAGGDAAAARPGGAGQFAGDAGSMPSIAEVKTISFAPATPKGGAGKSDDGQGFIGARPDAPPTVIEASPDYLPPNSYAPARVIVGVDASAGVSSQTDPLPVVLRITGPARSVVNNGRVLTTRLEGCVVNGAARGDLSAEKVYVKLAKMTCDQPGGRVAVSEVKGFISFAGKTGVRGKVVSREGSLVTQAFIAGIAGGFGRGFSANANALFQGAQTVVNGEREQLSAGDLAKAGIGQGVAQSADMVSKYLIERAEQYQPVIEMPTGIDVEIVFLDGVYVRGSQ
jgi:conjugal transfer pilus assembly protein TraB